MIVISRRRLIISLLLLMASMLVLLGIGISLLSDSPLDKSLEKQKLFYWGLIITLFQISISISVFIGHRKLIADINRITSYKDMNHPQSRRILRQMGSLGDVLINMMKDLNSLLELRMNRISASSKVLKILCEDYPGPLLISDTLGNVLGASEILTEKTGIPLRSDSQLIDFFPDIKLGEVLVSLEKNREGWKEESEKGLICTPVFDRGEHLNLCLWEIETSHVFQKLSKGSVKNKPQRAYNSLKGLFKNRGEKKKEQ